MRLLRHIGHLAAVIIMMALPYGCLFQDDDVFEESASARMSGLMDDARSAIQKHPEGWVLQYFSKENLGGYNYVIVFDGGKARISCETAGPDRSDECLWDIIKEDGAVLTFNTYSELLQQFHEPSMSDVDGSGGDYEFLIQSVDEDDTIHLQGKIGGSRMTMFPLPSGYSPGSWLEAVSAMERNLGGDFYIYSDSWQRIGSSVGQLKGRVLCITEGKYPSSLDYDYKKSVVYTPDGFKLQSELEIDGFHGREFKLDVDRYVASDGNLILTGNGLVPPSYEEMAGVWALRYNNYFGKFFVKGVTISTSTDGKTLHMHNLFSNKELDNVKLKYENGRLHLYAQSLGKYNGYYVWGLLFDAKQSTVQWGETTSVRGVYDIDNGHECFYFSDCGTAVGDYSADGFILYEFTTEEPDINTKISNLDILCEICLYREKTE